MERTRLVWTVLIVALCGAVPVVAQKPPEDEFLEFARRIEETINRGDGSFFDSRFDLDALLHRVVDGVEVADEFEEGFRAGFAKSPSRRLGEAVATSVFQEGSYTFLRLKDDPPRAVFRLSSSQGLNYHELLLGNGPEDEVFFHDVYIYLSGELFSETLRRVYVSVAAQQNRGFMERLLGIDREYYHHLPQIRQMSVGVLEGKHEQSLRIYHDLPESIQGRKEILITRLQAALNVGNEEIIQAAEAFQRAFPDDPAVDLMQIDYLFLTQRWDQLFETIERLDTRVGGDPYLDVFRANVRSARDEWGEAKTLLLQALEEDPWLEDGWASLLDVSMALEDFALTANALERLEQDFGYQWPDLRELPEFGAFCESAAYRAWIERSHESLPTTLQNDPS